MSKNYLRAAMSRLFGSIVGVRTEEPVVALTFDDGPHPIYTPRLLDIFDRFDAKGTFFVTGAQAQAYPEIIDRMVATGHALGCHSYDHPSFPLINSKERRRQIRACSAALAGRDNKLFRPPFGNQSTKSYFDVRLMGYDVVMWTDLAEDWAGQDADFISQKLRGVITPGSIALLHDNLFDALDEKFVDHTPTLVAIERILQEFGQRFRFVTVPQLLTSGRSIRKLSFRPPDKEFLSRLRATGGLSKV